MRTNVSWLEFWLYMCNGDENILDKFDYNPLLESTERAKELIEELASELEITIDYYLAEFHIDE